jgi:hypothetical protein
LVCCLPSYLAFISHFSFVLFYFFDKKKNPPFFSLHMQKKGRPTSVGGAHSKSKEFHIPQLVDEREHTPPPPPGFAPSTATVADEERVSNPPEFAPSTAAENEAIISPPPGFSPSTAPADEKRASPPHGFAPSTATVADEERVSPPLVLLFKKDFSQALYYLQHGVCHSEP